MCIVQAIVMANLNKFNQNMKWCALRAIFYEKTIRRYANDGRHGVKSIKRIKRLFAKCKIFSNSPTSAYSNIKFRENILFRGTISQNDWTYKKYKIQLYYKWPQVDNVKELSWGFFKVNAKSLGVKWTMYNIKILLFCEKNI